ncbi:ATP-dependent helicase HrpB [Vreelandella aquamarina]|uniref:ATP-dependent helicase HrpB n=1 Tax=Vreelandella aquamarina TaxID=77097 RepID=UPI00384DDA68
MLDNDANRLPVDEHLDDITRALSSASRLILMAQPGAGKTTRVPLALLQQPWVNGQKILLLEPRRVAARLAATFMAEQLEESVGASVGYRMRGETRCVPSTRLEVVTQGVLTRMLQEDPFLEGVACIIFDEFHERSLEADLGLTLALDIQQSVREDLRLLVMSATLDTIALRQLLGQNTPLIECPGRQYPVTTAYRPCIDKAAIDVHCGKVVDEALADNTLGDILVILPGVKEIEQTARRLRAQNLDVRVTCLHGRMPLSDQREALTREHGHRKVILATAIVESSVTIQGVNCVIDAGLERVPVYQPRSGAGRLETRRVNRASADQRRGRAGRQGPGTCYRLWAKEQPLPAHREPEIQQADLAGLVFELARWGVSDPGLLTWMTPPPQGAWRSGQQLLLQLGVLDHRYRLTTLGQRCGRWPLPPRLAVMLEGASRFNATPLACLLAALLQSGERLGPHPEHMLAQALTAPIKQRTAWHLEAQRLARIAGVELTIQHAESLAPLGALLTLAYPERIAHQLAPGRFQLANGIIADMPLDSPEAHQDWLLVIEWYAHQGRQRIGSAVRVEKAVMTSLFPEMTQWQPQVYWSEQEGKLIAREVQALGAIELVSRSSRNRLSKALVDEALVAAIQRRGYLSRCETFRQLQGRMHLLREHDPESDWPDWSDDSLLETLEDWLVPYFNDLQRLSAVDQLPIGNILLETLSFQARKRLDGQAPVDLKVPAGRCLTLDYRPCRDGQPPVMAAKLQALFGWQTTPRLVNNRVKVLVHLLSPAGRPLQVTQDLAHFWQNGYAEVRKEMRGRYPKHPWPENPLTAAPTSFTKRRQD